MVRLHASVATSHLQARRAIRCCCASLVMGFDKTGTRTKHGPHGRSRGFTKFILSLKHNVRLKTCTVCFWSKTKTLNTTAPILRIGYSQTVVHEIIKPAVYSILQYQVAQATTAHQPQNKGRWRSNVPNKSSRGHFVYIIARALQNRTYSAIKTKNNGLQT